MVAPVPAQISKLPRRKLSCPTRRSGPNSRPVNLLQPLFPCSVAPVLCFQQLAASFPKTPGWGVPRFPLRPPTSHYPLLATHSPLTTFRMNTCEKQGEGGTPDPDGLVTCPSFVHGIIRRLNALTAKGRLRETFPRTPSYIKAS